MAYINSEDMRLYYEETGQGEPVVFIHGGFSRGDSAFAAQIPVFSRNYRVLCPDLRGHGRTITNSPHWETPQLADDILLLLDELHIAKAHFVGHSMGGDVTMYCAIRSPERVITATSIASTGVANAEVKKYVRELHPENLRKERRNRFVERIQNDHSLAHKGDWEGFILETIKNCERYPDFTETELKSISVPFLLLYGDGDTMIDVEEVAVLENAIPHFATHVIKNADHYLHMPNRQCDTVNKVLLDFFTLHRCAYLCGP